MLELAGRAVFPAAITLHVVIFGLLLLPDVRVRCGVAVAPQPA